jgi:hypothetical protein
MLRSDRPLLIAQEIAAWARGTEMTRGVTRAAARAARPARCRDLSLTRARRLILAAIRSGNAGHQALTRQIGRFRNICDRGRHRPRKSKSPSAFPHAGLKDTVTRTAPALITLANTPA